MVVEFIQQELNKIKEQNLFRELRTLESKQDTWIVINGKKVLNLCSNNYLGLAFHPALKQKSIQTIKKFGCSSGASRLISGNNMLYCELEKKISEFKKTSSAVIFNSGYTANIGVISSLMDEKSIIFSDKLNHASIIDGILLSRAKFVRYPHKDINFLEKEIIKYKNINKKLIITDTVFSMDGDIAPLPDLVRISKKYNCLLMIDEAHATGILGKNGRGAVEYFNLNPEDITVHMGTFSKAMGSFGAYVCGSKDLIDFIINKARSLIYTTALPPSILASNIASIEVIQEYPKLRENLWDNVNFLKSSLLEMKFNILDSQTHIIPIFTKETDITMKFSNLLFEEGIFLAGIRPPTVPNNQARLRLSLMATHKKHDLEFAVDKLKKIGKKLGII